MDSLVIGRKFKLHGGPWWCHLDKVDLAISKNKFHWDSRSLWRVASVAPLSLPPPLLVQLGGTHGYHPWQTETKPMILAFRGGWQPTLQIWKQMCCWSSISPFHHCIVGNNRSLQQRSLGMSLPNKTGTFILVWWFFMRWWNMSYPWVTITLGCVHNCWTLLLAQALAVKASVPRMGRCSYAAMWSKNVIWRNRSPDPMCWCCWQQVFPSMYQELWWKQRSWN